MLPFARNTVPDNVIHMRVKGCSRISNIIGYALRHFQPEECRCILFSGSGNGVTKTISCVEIMKRKFKNVHQLNKICYKKVEEIWTPKVLELEKLKVTREIPAIFVLLSKDKLKDESDPGFQSAGSVQGVLTKRSADGRPREKPRKKPFARGRGGGDTDNSGIGYRRRPRERKTTT